MQYSLQAGVSFTGEILSNFDLKNMISTYTKDLLLEKWPKFATFQILKKKLPESYDNFQKLAKNIEAFCFFPTFIFIM